MASDSAWIISGVKPLYLVGRSKVMTKMRSCRSHRICPASGPSSVFWLTWGMVRGWIGREHYLEHFDPAKWQIEGAAPKAEVTGGGALADSAVSAPNRDE